MAYEWKFNKRPYTDEEAKELLKTVIDAETTDWHYNTHHKGYVTFMNNIEKELETADRAKANGNYSNVGELKEDLPGIMQALFFTMFTGKCLAETEIRQKVRK